MKLKLSDYLNRRNELKKLEAKPRENCSKCGFSTKTCYCSQIKRFDSKIVFVILIHKIEIERKIATGRMSYLILENSLFIPGKDYSFEEQVNKLINNPQNHCVVLFPGKDSINLSQFDLDQKKDLFPSDKQLVIFVIDGTWATARHTMRVSQNLIDLPRISFDLVKPSNFRIRKQPKRECCSTIEAIHHCIEQLGPSRGFSLESRTHDNLLHVFDYMVEQQIVYQKIN